MEKLSSSFKNMFLVLAGISLFAAATIASIYSLTEEPIKKAKTAKEENAIREVLPANFEKIGEIEKIGIIKIFKAYNAEGKFIGAAVESVSNKGYSGDIKIMVGFDIEGNIINYSVLEQKETPGLGTKIVDWFKTDKHQRSIIGKNPAKNKINVIQDGGEVDAITAATISSRAFLDAVVNAYNAYAANSDAPVVDGNTGATTVDY